MKIKPLIITALVLTASLADAQTIKHPSLLFTPDRVEAAEKAMKKAPSLAEGWKSIKAEADIQLQKGDIRKLEYLALAYMMTDSTKYADKIKEVLLNTAKIESWGDREMLARKPAWRSELQMAHKSFQLAVAYDAVYDRLTPAERKQIAEGVYRLAVEPALGDWLLAQLHGPQLVDFMRLHGSVTRPVDRQRDSPSGRSSPRSHGSHARMV